APNRHARISRTAQTTAPSAAAACSTRLVIRATYSLEQNVGVRDELGRRSHWECGLESESGGCGSRFYLRPDPVPVRRPDAANRFFRPARLPARGGGPTAGAGAAHPGSPEPGDRLVPAAGGTSPGGDRAIGRDLHRSRHPALPAGGRPGI